MMKTLYLAAFALLATIMAGVSQGSALSKQVSPHALGERSVFSDRAISERLRSPGVVCVEGDEECGVEAETTMAAAETGPRSGQAVYESACTACHATGAAGAPVMGDTAAWQARLSEKGKDTLFANSISGIGAMPAKGMCMDCSDEELIAAVEYILEQSQ